MNTRPHYEICSFFNPPSRPKPRYFLLVFLFFKRKVALLYLLNLDELVACTFLKDFMLSQTLAFLSLIPNCKLHLPLQGTGDVKRSRQAGSRKPAISYLSYCLRFSPGRHCPEDTSSLTVLQSGQQNAPRRGPSSSVKLAAVSARVHAALQLLSCVPSPSPQGVCVTHADRAASPWHYESEVYPERRTFFLH